MKNCHYFVGCRIDSIPFGTVTVSPASTASQVPQGTKMTTTCINGYELSGDAEQTCEIYGWKGTTGTTPSCTHRMDT